MLVNNRMSLSDGLAEHLSENNEDNASEYRAGNGSCPPMTAAVKGPKVQPTNKELEMKTNTSNLAGFSPVARAASSSSLIALGANPIWKLR